MTCSQCGQELPRDDARFCNNCGAPLTTQIAHQEPQARKEAISPVSQYADAPQVRRTVLREQLAHQPRPARLTKNIAPNNWLPPAPPEVPENAQLTHQQQQELPVYAWNKEDMSSRQSLPIEELPTQKTPASPSNVATHQTSSPATLNPTPFFGLQGPPAINESVVDPDATQLVSHRSVNGFDQLISSPATQSQPGIPLTPDPQLSFSDSPSAQPVYSMAKQAAQADSMPFAPAPFMPRHFTSSEPYSRPADNVAGLTPTASPSPRNVRRGLTPLMLLGVVLTALIIAAIVWISLVQPFNVPTVTKPLQDYQNTHLGIALSYPNGWTVTHHGTSDQFTDSSQTAQVTVTLLPGATVADGNVSAYLQKHASEAGIAGAKIVTQATFAGATWQQVQGTAQINGVNDTETFYATLHKSQLFIFMQTAPQSVYADEESVVFSKMRVSLHLL